MAQISKRQVQARNRSLILATIFVAGALILGIAMFAVKKNQDTRSPAYYSPNQYTGPVAPTNPDANRPTNRFNAPR